MSIARARLNLLYATICALAVALLFAQWTGLAHRIDHAPLSTLHAQSAEEDDSGLNHSCVAFDAAAVADAIHLPPCAVPILASAKVLALWAAFESWDAPLVLHFSSRAPPLS